MAKNKNKYKKIVTVALAATLLIGGYHTFKNWDKIKTNINNGIEQIKADELVKTKKELSDAKKQINELTAEVEDLKEVNVNIENATIEYIGEHNIFFYRTLTGEDIFFEAIENTNVNYQGSVLKSLNAISGQAPEVATLTCNEKYLFKFGEGSYDIMHDSKVYNITENTQIVFECFDDKGEALDVNTLNTETTYVMNIEFSQTVAEETDNIETLNIKVTILREYIEQ